MQHAVTPYGCMGKCLMVGFCQAHDCFSGDAMHKLSKNVFATWWMTFGITMPLMT
jgi:hypothetical protein